MSWRGGKAFAWKERNRNETGEGFRLREKWRKNTYKKKEK